VKVFRIRVHFPDWLTRFFPQSVWRMPAGENKVYLTFDDGPVPEVTPAILDILRQNDIKATFFCVGDNVSKHPAIYRQILTDGHATGNHTYNHIKGLGSKTKHYLDNVEQAARYIQSDLFRPPYGMMKQTQFLALRKKYRIILWDVISCDYDASLSPQQCIANVMDFVRDGSIITFHDSQKARNNVLEALPRVIQQLKQRGYSFDKIDPAEKKAHARHPFFKNQLSSIKRRNRA